MLIVIQSETNDFPKIFEKELTFRQLNKFPKQHKEFVFNKDIPQTSCLCEICENLTFLAKSISSKVNIPIETNVHSLVEVFSCDSSSKECMYSTCEECCDTRLKITDFRNEEADIHFYQWKRVNKKVQKLK